MPSKSPFYSERCGGDVRVSGVSRACLWNVMQKVKCDSLQGGLPRPVEGPRGGVEGRAGGVCGPWRLRGLDCKPESSLRPECARQRPCHRSSWCRLGWVAGGPQLPH